jgi:hypothetical protein
LLLLQRKNKEIAKISDLLPFQGCSCAGWLKLRVAERHRNLKNMVEGLLKLPEENELPLQRKGDALTGDAHQEI